MAKELFNEEEFMELLKKPSTLNSETIVVKGHGVLPKKLKE